jgi:predicted ATPase/DNA-binding winged helix-turn-helix (wHTH) protein
VSGPDRVLVHESGTWELDLGRRELRARGAAVPIGGRAFEILAVLAQSAEDLVGKDDLMKRVWPGAVVEENTLQVHISAIRRALGGDREMLKTASGRGYRLLGAWMPREAAATAERTSHEPTSVARPAFQTNLPATVSELVGRAFAARHLASVMSAYRAVTLTGPGGIGKTALALHVARSVFAGGQGDAYLVDLASLLDPRLVPSAIAAVLDLRLGGEQAGADSVARAIGGKQFLLVLDNCEHLIDAVARSVETIVRMCPLVSVLGTSRENLRIEGEYVYRVAPLSVPSAEDQEPDVILAQSAVQLFVNRMSASRPAFLPDPGELLEIAAICRQLDGIPLAIEFAAARASSLGLKQVAARLGDRFGLLTAGRRTALPRHQTLYATLDWSYELLPDEERRLLRRVAIFPAGFTVAAATAVVSDVAQATSSVIDGIANLVDKSLLNFEGPPSAGRWRLLETIRAYALEKLRETGEAEKVAQLSAEFLRDLFRPAVAATTGRPDPDRAPGLRDIDNIRAAIDWAMSATGDLVVGIELTADSAPLWFQLSLMTEYRARVERALAGLKAMSEPDAALEMRLQVGLGHALWYTGPDAEPEAMQGAFARALALAERVGDTDVQLKALWGAWAVRRGRGDHDAALAAATRYQAIASSAADKRLAILADRILALTHHDLGDQNLARGHVEKVLSQAPHLDPRSNNDLQVDARVAMLSILARIQWLQGFPEQAIATAEEAIDATLRMDHWFSICYVLFTAGCPLSLWVGDLAEAERRLDMLRDRTGGNPGFNRYARIYAAVLRLRQGSEADRLTAAYIEPRVQYSMMGALGELVSAATVPLPSPGDLPCQAPWSQPEVLRVDAELLLWRGGTDAVGAAEAKLAGSLELAREQSALGWELRTALSLAHLRRSQDRPADARDVLAAALDKFTEGFDTVDLRSARAVLQSLQ